MLKGVHFIVITPFGDDGRIDFASLETLVENILATGVHGVTALGVAAEAHKLSAAERIEVGCRIFDVVGGRCGIIVGTSADRIEEVVETSLWAEAAGARGVMVAPPHGLQFGPALIAHYAALSDSIRIEIVLQDYAEVTGVELSPENIAELVLAVPAIRAVKLESVPTPPRIAATRRLVGDGLSILGGLGAVSLLDELRSGADGTMTGFAYPEMLLDIWGRFDRGDAAGAQAAYDLYRPLLEFEGQPGIGLAIRKEVLRRRGLIANASVRGQPPLPVELLRGLDRVLAATGAQRFVC